MTHKSQVKTLEIYRRERENPDDDEYMFEFVVTLNGRDYVHHHLQVAVIDAIESEGIQLDLLFDVLHEMHG